MRTEPPVLTDIDLAEPKIGAPRLSFILIGP